MELRQPPTNVTPSAATGVVRALLALLALAVIGIVVLAAMVVRGNSLASGGAAPEKTRELANKLKAAGALDQAAEQYEAYLASGALAPEERARVAYSLGTTFLERGEYEKSLRWFYEADLGQPGDLSEELGRKIVHTLERMGRVHAAQSALASRVELGDGETSETAHPDSDPVVARIGSEEIRRSDVQRALDELHPEQAASIRTAEHREQFVRQFVAAELLWRKAQKLEFDRDKEVLQRHEAALRELAVARLMEDEVVNKVVVDEADVRNFFEVNKERYARSPGEGQERQVPSFEDARGAVERDYRMSKVQAGYQALIESELAAESVEIFAERMEDSSQ